MDSVLACRTYLVTASIVVTNTACMATVVLEPKRWMTPVRQRLIAVSTATYVKAPRSTT